MSSEIKTGKLFVNSKEGERENKSNALKREFSILQKQRKVKNQAFKYTRPNIKRRNARGMACGHHERTLTGSTGVLLHCSK